MKKFFSIIVLVLMTLMLVACDDASVASQNISRDADNFRVYRRVVFYNSFTNDYILVIEGYCNIVADTVDDQVEVTLKVAEDQYLKHYLGLSDNVTYVVEQLEAINVPVNHYVITYKPDVVLPYFEDES